MTEMERMNDFVEKHLEDGDQVVILSAGRGGIAMDKSAFSNIKDVLTTFYNTVMPQ